MNPIKRVAIVGGTHGNELTGAYLIKKFEQFPELVQRSGLETLTLLGNPSAFEVGRRYVDKDLNRCFLSQDLQDLSRSTCEEKRAREIYRMFTTELPVDVIVDLHSTTASMGLTLILNNSHPFNLKLAAALTTLNPLVKVFRWAYSAQDTPFLRSLCELGCAIEVGAIAQGVLDAALFRQTEELIYTVLDYLERYNQGDLSTPTSPLTLYQCMEMVDYPRDQQGKIAAMIHPELQGRDYEALHPGDPLFLTFAGETRVYEGFATVYPVFINEAAYYEKGIALCLTQQQEIMLD